LPPPFDSIAGTLALITIPSDYKETAVFANGSYRFNDVFKIDAGIRYAENDQEFSQNVTEGILAPLGSVSNSSSEDVFTWSVSPQLKLSEDAMVYARVATGYQPGGPNVLVEGLPAQVDSSTLTSYELGLKSQLFDNRVVFDLTGFYIDWSDIQVASVVNNISGLVNAGKASTAGIEWSALLHASDRLDLGFNGAYTNAQLDENYPVISVPVPSQGLLQEITSGLKGDSLPYVPEWSWAGTCRLHPAARRRLDRALRRRAALRRSARERHDRSPEHL
jgi:outer membrane receptor protein involved in Fe transport